VCGEQKCERTEEYGVEGSPPRVRGAGQVLGASVSLLGITPACAGSSSEVLRRMSLAEDHPRVCGEQWQEGRARFARTGSPPRVRGAEIKNAKLFAEAGITPACAGSSTF